MIPSTKFPRRVRIHGGECGAVARALHHWEKIFSSPAAFKNVLNATFERKRMSTKTSFKRIALAVVVALGISMFGNAPASQGAIITSTETLSIDAGTDTAFTTETATAVLTSVWGTNQASANSDSVTIRATCVAPTGASCPTAQFWLAPSSDTANIQVDPATNGIMYQGYFTDTASSTTGGSAKAVVNVKAVNFSKAGTYVYTFYTQSTSAVSAVAPVVSALTTTWTITVTDRDSAAAGVNLYSVDASMASAQATLDRYRLSFLSPRESAVTAVRGLATSPTAVLIAAVTAKNAAGETTVATAQLAANSSGPAIKDTFTVTITGPGLVSVPNGASSTRGKSATLSAQNGATYPYYSGVGETLVVWSDGTAGTGTVAISTSGGTVLKSFTVTFTGTPASVQNLSVTDTVTAISATAKTGYLKFNVLDSGSNVLTTGNTVYVYASDTRVVSTGALSTSASQYTQSAAGVRPNTSAHACTYSSTAAMFSCDLTISDTGTATLYVRDSWTVTGSTWVSTGIDITALGTAAKSYTVTFDKASYNVGDQAIITITGKDAADRALASGGAGLGTVLTNYSLGNSGNILRGTAGSGSATSSTWTPYTPADTGIDSGIETRVVTMPSTAGTMTFSLSYVPVFGTTAVTASASVPVVDPIEAVIKKTVGDAQAAADAATDAALQAIDAANAATDAANLAAEAADAATVAAQESKDAADAATAAVESLATQVATLMAALQAQITSLANVVAKIAKKVKA